MLAVLLIAAAASAAPRGPRPAAGGGARPRRPDLGHSAAGPLGHRDALRVRGGGEREDAQLAKLREGEGFVAALDQSGGSTPDALARYGVDYDEASWRDDVHAMRERIVTSPSFGGDRVLAAILFADTAARDFGGAPAATYLWETKNVVPLMKIDAGLEAAADGVMLMKPVGSLDATLAMAAELGFRGTKARSRICAANAEGIKAVVDQQFAIAKRVLAAGLVPIVEPEVDLDCEDKGYAEELLLNAIREALRSLRDGEMVMLKLALPEIEDLYASCVAHPNVLRVLALSGGLSRDDACAKLRQNNGVIASFSRALAEGLAHSQDAAAFDARLDASAAEIAGASRNKVSHDPNAPPARYADIHSSLGK